MSANNFAAAELFLEWANFWQPPEADFWRDVAAGHIDASIEALTVQFAYPASLTAPASFRSLLPPLPELQAFFHHCFTGPGNMIALPIESIYKNWTDDPSARLPIAGCTGYLLGDSALHVQYLLDQYGLSVPQEYRATPDHLLLLLELAAFLLQKRSQQEIQIFLSQHLDWLDQFAQALAAVLPESESDHQAKRFYLQALELLQQTVNLQLRLSI